MVKELILHLGDCKTGSTAVQSCLAGGGYVLARGRLCYPAPMHHNALALSVGRISDEAQDHGPHLETRFREMARTLAASDADWGVISAELFEFVEPAALKEALDRFLPEYRGRTRLIAYVRPHHARVLSSYAEGVKKTGGPESLASFAQARMGRDWLSFHPRFAAWRDQFGAAFTLRPFLRDRLLGGDVVHDFMAFVTGGTQTRITDMPLRNPSLSLPELAMLRLAHHQLGASGPGRWRWRAASLAGTWRRCSASTARPAPRGCNSTARWPRRCAKPARWMPARWMPISSRAAR